ncbi:hypothetical protein BJG92_01251 [Arthrobacter sp. SO5]|nr:hypothetical protein [Arthrobacter sp. SO5]
MTRNQDIDTLLRSLDAADHRGSADTLRARADLNRILATDPATASPIRIRRRVLMASAAAALLVGGIVVADVVVPGRPGATAEAAEVLNAAAAATITTSDPVVGPAQYLKIDTTSVYSSAVRSEDGSLLAWLDKTSDHLYVPADHTAEWTWNREARIPTTFFSEAAKAEASKQQQLMADAGRDGSELLRAPGGKFYKSERQLFGMPLDEGIKTLPRDPKALLKIIQAWNKGAGRSPETKALTDIAETLRTGVIPADLRAALYKSAALIPGVSVVDRQATLDGKTGVAIGIDYPDGRSRMDIIIGPATGLLIGEREVMLKADENFPAGTAIKWTSVQTSVVNSAP